VTSYIVRAGFDCTVQLQIGGPFVSVKKGDKVFWRRGYRDLPKGPHGHSLGRKWVILSRVEDEPPPVRHSSGPVLFPNGREIRQQRAASRRESEHEIMGFSPTWY
jgi:hypothetical protein